MEMAEYRDDGVWEVVPRHATRHSAEWGREEPDSRTTWRQRRRQARTDRGRGPDIPAPRPRLIGWSLLFMAGSNLLIVAIVLSVGITATGLMAGAALSVCSWLLVLAEVLSLRRVYRRERT